MVNWRDLAMHLAAVLLSMVATFGVEAAHTKLSTVAVLAFVVMVTLGTMSYALLRRPESTLRSQIRTLRDAYVQGLERSGINPARVELSREPRG